MPSGKGSQGTLLVTLRGPDRPGLAARLFEAMAALDLSVLDVEQVQVHGQLLLCVEVAPAGVGMPIPGEVERVQGALGAAIGRLDRRLELTVSELGRLPSGAEEDVGRRHLVTVLAPSLGSTALAGVFGQVASAGGNVDRVVRLSTYPVVSYELSVSGAEAGRLRRELAVTAARLQVDVAVQRAGLHRRAKHLIVLDADSTLLQGEVIDAVAARAGCAAEVAAVTARAMAGELDFARAMDERLSLLAGLDQSVLDEVRDDLRLTPGARTLIRTLQHLGYVTALVSGGFEQVLGPVVERLGIDHLAANRLEVAGGKLTGRLEGELVDRAGKAAALRRFARLAGVPLSRTIAVGDGANDLDMLAAAGLGIAFNAKPVVRDAADAALSVPYLDAILFLLGISRPEIEAVGDA